MGNRMKQAAIGAGMLIAAASFQNHAGAMGNAPEISNSNGFIAATKEMHTNELIGLIRIDGLKAASFPNKTSFIGAENDDTIADGEASIQLNAFLKGVRKGGKQQLYWVQNVITIGYKNGYKAYQYQSEIYPGTQYLNPDLKLSDVKGKGSIYAINNKKPGEGNTYIWSSDFKKFDYPMSGYLVIREKLDKGQIGLGISYINVSSNSAKDNEEIKIDDIKIGRRGEFSKSYFTIDDVRDAELGIGGGGNGDVSYFSRLKAYLGIFAYDDSHFSSARLHTPLFIACN